MLKKQELLNQLLEMKNDMNQKRYFFNGYIIEDEGSREMSLFEIKKITRDSKEVAKMLNMKPTTAYAFCESTDKFQVI